MGIPPEQNEAASSEGRKKKAVRQISTIKNSNRGSTSSEIGGSGGIFSLPAIMMRQVLNEKEQLKSNPL